MKTANKNILIAAVIGMIATSTTSMFAQTNVLTIDENGHGNYNGVVLPSGLAPDPFSGFVTLMYALPFSTTPGDVQLFETAGANAPSDIVRFDGRGHLFFFSDKETTDVPPFDLADGPLPPLLTTLPFVSLVEVGPEGQNGAIFSPLPTDPGFNVTGAPVLYNIISDLVVPEPSTFALAGLGAAALMIFRRRD